MDFIKELEQLLPHCFSSTAVNVNIYSIQSTMHSSKPIFTPGSYFPIYVAVAGNNESYLVECDCYFNSQELYNIGVTVNNRSGVAISNYNFIFNTGKTNVFRLTLNIAHTDLDTIRKFVKQKVDADFYKAVDGVLCSGSSQSC